MTTFTWNGGYNLFDAPKGWSPAGVPGAGDTAVIDSGGALARFEDVPATVVLGNTDQGAQPALGLLYASAGTLTMPHDLPPQPYTTVASPTQYGTVYVAGQSSIGAIDLGASAGTVRAPSPYGHGPLTAPDNLTVDLVGPSTLDAGFHVRDGSTLTVNGGDGAAFNATDSLMEGGSAAIDTALGGDARIVLAHGSNVDPESAYATGGSLELGGSVGAGDTIDIRVGSLQIDRPMQFQGQIDMVGDQRFPDPSYVFGPRSVELEGLAATGFGFDDPSHTLTLFDNGAAVDQLHFTSDVTAASFSATGEQGSNGIRVVQTDAGVFLRGSFADGPLGATPIPLLPSQT